MRNPTAFVQVKLRIRGAEHAQLAAAAKRNGVTMSGEMAARLARTLRDQGTYEVSQMAVDVRRALGPLLENAHAVAMSGEAARAADDLVALVQPLLDAGVIDGPTGAEIRAAIDRYIVTKRASEIVARQRLIKIGASS